MSKAFSDIVDSEFFRMLGGCFADFGLFALLALDFFLDFTLVGLLSTLLLEVKNCLVSYTLAADHLFGFFFFDGPV